MIEEGSFGVLALLVGGGLAWIAYFFNFFVLKEDEESNYPWVTPSIFAVLIAFLIYFGVQILFVVIVQVINGFNLPTESMMKVGISALSLAVFVLIGFSMSIRLFSKKPSFSVFKTGFIAWLIAFPLVLGIYNILLSLLEYIVGPQYPLQQQDVVRTIQQLEEYPDLFWAFFIVVGFLVPLAEEILFRGFLQRWLCARFKNRWGVIIASFCFAGLHFSSPQGLANFVILPSLFILSLFIGFVYLKERSLWAPIAVHALHNSFSLFMV